MELSSIHSKIKGIKYSTIKSPLINWSRKFTVAESLQNCLFITFHIESVSFLFLIKATAQKNPKQNVHHASTFPSVRILSTVTKSQITLKM